jgi:hypothetical protein
VRQENPDKRIITNRSLTWNALEVLEVEYDLGEELVKYFETFCKVGDLRPDINWHKTPSSHVLYEIKPDNDKAIKTGTRQLRRYIDALQVTAHEGGKHDVLGIEFSFNNTIKWDYASRTWLTEPHGIVVYSTKLPPDKLRELEKYFQDSEEKAIAWLQAVAMERLRESFGFDEVRLNDKLLPALTWLLLVVFAIVFAIVSLRIGGLAPLQQRAPILLTPIELQCLLDEFRAPSRPPSIV